MGRRKKETKPTQFLQDTGSMPEKKHIEMSPSAFFKMMCHTLFDVSPAGAFLENSLDVARGLPASTASKEQASSSHQKQLEWSKPVLLQHSEASSSEFVQYGVGKHTSRSYSIQGSPQHGGGRLLNVFKRKSSKKSKEDTQETNRSNTFSVDESNRDIYYNGDVSSESLFEIQVEESIRTYSKNDENSNTDSQFRVNRLESEVEVLRRRLEQEAEEVKKLKDEISSLRSSSGSSQVPSPRSPSGSDRLEGFGRAVSPSESSTTSDLFDGDHDSQTFMEFCPSDEGQLVKLVRQERSRLRIYTPRVSNHGEVSLAKADKDVTFVRRSSLSKEDLEQPCSELMVEHMDAFLSDAAALGKSGMHEYMPIGFGYPGIGNQSSEGPCRMSRAAQSSKEKEPSLEVGFNISEENCGDDDTSRSPLNSKRTLYSKLTRSRDSVASKETGTSQFTFTESSSGKLKPLNKSLADDVIQHKVLGGSDEIVESGKLQEWLSKEIDAHSPKTSIMDFGVPDDPELAEMRRQVRVRYQEMEEKFMKMLSPRRDRSTSSASASSSGTSSPLSIGSRSPGGSFRENENSGVNIDVCENGCSDSCACCDPSIESVAPAVKSDMQSSKLTRITLKDLDLELASPREILVSKFGSLAKSHSLLPPQSEITEEEVDTSPGGVPEVYFHPTLSRDLSFSVLTGYKQQIDHTARGGGEISPAADLAFSISPDYCTGTNLEEHAEVYMSAPSDVDADSHRSNGNHVRSLLSSGSSCSRRTRFGEEAAKLALQRSSSHASDDSRYSPKYRIRRYETM